MKAIMVSKKAVNATEQKRSKLYMFKRSERKQKHMEDDHFFWDFDKSGYYKNNSSCSRTLRPKLVYPLLVFLISCTFIFTPHLFSSSALSLLYSFGTENHGILDTAYVNAPLCSSVSNGNMCCDRSSIRSDICIMKGDVRTQAVSSSVILYIPRNTESFRNYEEDEELRHEKIRPYTRKWETSVMDTIDELDLLVKKENATTNHHCDVQHNVPAVFFSTGGYTGNLYHEFNDGILPLYITSQHFNKQVVFVILEYHNWWIMKYGDILSHLSNYPVIDYSGDKRTHCFPEAIVGLRIHDELAVEPSLIPGNKSIVDFRNLLDRAYMPRIKRLVQVEKRKAREKLRKKTSLTLGALLDYEKQVTEAKSRKPKLVILSRNGSRAIINENSLVKLAEKIGFSVQVLRPEKTTELAKIYRELNGSDVMVGVHGAAMTHFLFMKPGCVFIQVIPLGTDWAAETYYGEPARKLGLKYIGYQILPRESSLYDEYHRNDPVLRDPNSVNQKGWNYTKKIYLDGQNVRLHLGRFYKRLARAYKYSINRNNSHHKH